MDPHAPQHTPASDDEEEIDALGEPDDSKDGLTPTDGEPLEDDVDKIQEPLDEDGDDEPDDTQESGEIQEALSQSDDLEHNTSISDNSDEANAFEDDEKPSPLP